MLKNATAASEPPRDDNDSAADKVPRTTAPLFLKLTTPVRNGFPPTRETHVLGAAALGDDRVGIPSPSGDNMSLSPGVGITPLASLCASRTTKFVVSPDALSELPHSHLPHGRSQASSAPGPAFVPTNTAADMPFVPRPADPVAAGHTVIDVTAAADTASAAAVTWGEWTRSFFLCCGRPARSDSGPHSTTDADDLTSGEGADAGADSRAATKPGASVLTQPSPHACTAAPTPPLARPPSGCDGSVRLDAFVGDGSSTEVSLNASTDSANDASNGTGASRHGVSGGGNTRNAELHSGDTSAPAGGTSSGATAHGKRALEAVTTKVKSLLTRLSSRHGAIENSDDSSPRADAARGTGTANGSCDEKGSRV